MSSEEADAKRKRVATEIRAPRVGIVVLNYNSADETVACLEALRVSNGGRRKTWVVDNASTDYSETKLPELLLDEEVWLETGENLGYAGGNNVAIRQALEWGAEYILLVNPDVRVSRNFLPPLIRALEASKSSAMACPLVLEEDGRTIQSYGGSVNLWTGSCARRLNGRQGEGITNSHWEAVDFPHGACVLIKRSFLEAVGLLNEGYFLYYEDVELGLRAAKESWTVLAVGASKVNHSDTTELRKCDPVVVYFGTRNQAWTEIQYANPLQLTSFLIVSLLVRWPLNIFLHLAKGKGKAAAAVIRGVFAGLFSGGWNSTAHLAVPRSGRPFDDTAA